MAVIVSTIGYEDAAPSDFLRSLRAAGIATVIDVRALTNSRRPGYAKGSLTATLTQAGIGYRHIRALGTPPEGREAARRGDYAGMRRIFADKLATHEAEVALAELAALAVDEPICLLCLEANPAHCHRTMIADALDQHWGFQTQHLHPSGGWAKLPPRTGKR